MNRHERKDLPWVLSALALAVAAIVIGAVIMGFR
jgi:hypothetical protein